MRALIKKRYQFCRLLTLYFLCIPVLAQAQRTVSPLADESYGGYSMNQGLRNLNGGSGWKAPWAGDAAGDFAIRPALEYEGIRLGAGRVVVTSASVNQSVYREIAKPARNFEGTLWLRFFYRKVTGNGRSGFSLLEGEREKLFIGSKAEGEKTGSNSVNIGDERIHMVVVRLDYEKDRQAAWVFIDPGVASIPDPEGANANFAGDFRFDRVSFSADAGKGNIKTVADFGPVRITNDFEDAVSITASSRDNSTAGPGTIMKVISWKKKENRLVITTTGGVLQLTPFGKNTVKVQFGTLAAVDSSKSFAVDSKPSPRPFYVKETGSSIELRSGDYVVRIIKETGRLQLFNRSGRLLLEESPGGGRQPVIKTSVVAAEIFKLSASEAIFGLGQFRDGFLNLRGKRRELVQFNTQSAVPVILSTNGWGLFWDNPSRTVFSDAESGMSFVSDKGNEIRYYLFVGSGLDSLIAQYRNFTGEAPMLPRWALGFHQSRNRYATREQVLSVAGQMREEKIPFSSIFVDYYYWGKYGTGSHRFDETIFPGMPGLADSLHRSYHSKLVVTVWPSFKPGTPNYDSMKSRGFLLNGVKALDGIVYDAFNPKAAALYWELIKKNMLSVGIDGWFLDGPEPDNISTFLPATTFYGPAANVRNVFPLVHSRTFYQGLLKCNPNKRPYILTRCAWASQQRNGTAIWSGDIPSTFDELKKQIPAGLNFVATGIPYWTTDIGGYSGGNPADPAYREVFTRWFQYGTFCPIFRSHGRRYPGDTKGPNELWAFGNEVRDICTRFDALRYRLMPYIYSLSGDITQKHYTAMRLLAFDFPGDSGGFNVVDQFMYGPAMLVCPVTDAGARQRKVYLPGGTEWINFWNGKREDGGKTIMADAPIEQIPIFIKSGSIIPMGRSIQYTDELSADTIELRVYTGRDGQFELYEDDGETFGYKKGGFRRTLFKWDESKKTLTIRDLVAGNFQGRLRQRTFCIVWVSPGSGTGFAESNPGTVICYSGKRTEVKYPG